MEETMFKEYKDKMLDYIMKNCLWQFNSRAWDRRRQNEGVIVKTEQILCGEAVDLETSADRCYWVDAVCLSEAFMQLNPGLSSLSKNEIRELLKSLHEELDFQLIDGSLNLELTDKHY
jgi:Fe-only nitrogenase delta subunit